MHPVMQCDGPLPLCRVMGVVTKTADGKDGRTLLTIGMPFLFYTSLSPFAQFPLASAATRDFAYNAARSCLLCARTQERSPPCLLRVAPAASLSPFAAR